jgi:hypothetical protein
MVMIKPNWNIFRVKFNENPQANFEWFCFLLFCREFGKTSGIFRYKNQSAIETAPISAGDEIIGWQAKFYDTPLAVHKDKIINTLDNIKRNYPSITKLIFYTNQEWGQAKGKDPEGKIEIEKKAIALGIKLVWRSSSFFESPLVSIDSDLISKHFFTLEHTIFDMLKEQQVHTENILHEIQTDINFNGEVIKIDRRDELKKINESVEQVIVLSGGGGVGKTALIKDMYEQMKEQIPIYIFKATEFELRSINDFFTGYNVLDFLSSHKEESKKIIVIDSAEKLLDFKNHDPFEEFIKIACNEKWKIIFTTRDSFLDNLNYQFELYNFHPLWIGLRDIEQAQLVSNASTYFFKLPKDNKLLDLIKNPFYLKEYLHFYNDEGEVDYSGFKERLWTKTIKKNKTSRSECFLKIALQRADKGSFFILPDYDASILEELVQDGILGYEENKGYFITHDIYEEWALEKIINREYLQKSDTKNFFEAIGQSLPIRRSFRKWVSEKLLLEDKKIENYIEDIVENEEIQPFWKDEMLVSILLSDFSEAIFNNSKTLFLAKEQELLKKTTFLLRTACKEVDESFFKEVENRHVDLLKLEYFLTKPMGAGWKSIIKFVYDNLDNIGIPNISFVLPVIHDWTSKYKEGETTKYSGLIALKYYRWIIKEDVYISHESNLKEKILQTILYGAGEIKEELKSILDEVVINRWKDYRDPYYDLSKCILTKLEGNVISKILPESVIQLADMFWLCESRKDDYGFNHSIGTEQYFGLEYDSNLYFPASSYQTPIYWLLLYRPVKTINFILNFTNKAVECFAKSELGKREISEVEVYIGQDNSIKQYICDRLWCAFRGTQVAPNLLESIHMALEKYFLEAGRNIDSAVLEHWLLYTLSNTKSASLSAVVTSIVLAYPEKTFNVAKILFQTKEFFLFETKRKLLDQNHKSQLLMLKNSLGTTLNNEIYEEERLNACDDKHRKWTLEDLFFYYQYFRDENTSEQEVKDRQNILWDILDNFYKKLLPESKQSDLDKTWRIYLARMDRRKMDITTKVTDSGVEINFNPEIEPELKTISEKSQNDMSQKMKYISLKVWCDYKMQNDEKSKSFLQYEDAPQQVIKEIKEINESIGKNGNLKALDPDNVEDDVSNFLNYSILGVSCSVLIRDYFDKLSKEEQEYCVSVVLKRAALSIGPSYRYYAGDGMQYVVSVLPILLKKIPNEKEQIKKILLLNLFNEDVIDAVGTRFNIFSIQAIYKLWESNFTEAQSLLFGYILLKPKYEDLKWRMRKENSEKKIWDEFLKENDKWLYRILNNQILDEYLGDIEQIDLYTLRTVFSLIPLKTNNYEHKIIAKEIISTFADKLMLNDRADRVDYKVRHDFMELFSHYVLSSPKEEIQELLNPFLNKFSNSEVIADLLKELIVAEDKLNSYENFWIVWNLFKEKIIEISKDGDESGYISKIIRKYLFAIQWNETAKEWHTLKVNDRIFLKEISERIGHCPSTLYSISKLLCDVGSQYLDDGMFWISEMLTKNQNLTSMDLAVNTNFYLENLAKKYIHKNRTELKEIKRTKDKLLVILNFLVSKGSAIGYILRESII